MERAWLTAKREAAGLKQSDVAERAGISQAYYSEIESGKKGARIPIKTARAIAEAIGFDWNIFANDPSIR